MSDKIKKTETNRVCKACGKPVLPGQRWIIRFVKGRELFHRECLEALRASEAQEQKAG